MESSDDEIGDQEECSNVEVDVFFTNCIQRFNKPIYEDITAMINSTVPTLVDGDALMLYAVLQESHPITFGNQFLHVAYVCERFLDILKQKGANCILVFFNFWELVWEHNLPLRTLRHAIYHHFKCNTNIRTYRFLWYYAPTFERFKQDEKPRCIISNLHYISSICEFNEKIHNENFQLNLNYATKIFASSLVYCISSDLPIIDINYVTVGATLIHSFNIPAKPLHIMIFTRCSKDLVQYIPAYKAINILDITHTGSMIGIKDLVLEAAAYFLENYNNQDELRYLLLYYATVLTLPLENRAPPKIQLTSEQLSVLQKIIHKWHTCLNIILHKIDKNKEFDFKYIADLWQGTLFVCILSINKVPIENGIQLGSLNVEYESLTAELNSRLHGHQLINPYPIQPIFKEECMYLEEEEAAYEMVRLTRVENPLIDIFCEDMFERVFWEDPEAVLGIRQYYETRHWHCRKPLTDNLSNVRKTAEIHSSKHADRMHQKEFRYTNIYGQSLEGKTTQYDAVIYQASKKQKSTSKKQSQSSKKMQEKIHDEKMKKALEDEKKELRKFKAEMNTAGNIKQLKNDLYYITQIINRMSCSETIIKAYLLKLKLLKALVSNEDAENKTNGIKDVLLLIRTILRMKDENNKAVKINEKDGKLISKLLHLYGFGEIRVRNSLPADESCKEEYQFNWVRFQLEHMGPDLLKEEGSPFDPDINFAPDKWQVDFIEAIRCNESALVVAPTSSGKTFASYYCMKRVLQYSPDGIVVYVAPTKPLVNQVAATVTHRFKNAKLPENGSSLVGIFTRDHRSNVKTSRILITVPQCLDILLMSPNHYDWNSKVSYVIFDEVHRLSGNEEGLVWERLLLLIRCPFLALSATISDANLFYQWLQNMELFKKNQDKLNNCLRGSYNVRCVIHEERHADLTKYVYVQKTLQRYHPYCTLHSNILLDRGKIPESITLSPRETMQLYDALSIHAEQYISPELRYSEFFDSRTECGFITRKSVREYETELGKIFYKVYEENSKVYKTILNMLTPPNYNGSSLGRESFTEGYLLLQHMAENNMLPAIVFSYNRNLVEKFCEFLISVTEPSDTEKTKKELKTEKLYQKSKLKGKDKRVKDEDRFDDADDFSALASALPDFNKNPVHILAPTTSKFKGTGIVDRDDLQFIETRLYHGYLKHINNERRQLICTQLQSGIAYHHAGVNKKLRDTAEMLFRIGILKVVVATGTLALGVHMPCKSVIVFGDSPYLNSLEYHQMSGRAGRRGFDNEGNVIFLGLTKKRHDMLITDSLPKMLGNYPINVTLIARLLFLIAGVEGHTSSDHHTKISISRAFTLLENSLLFEVKPHLKQQVKHFVGFALQLLLIQKIINTKGVPTSWSPLLIHLHYHEPANLALIYLLRCGALETLTGNTPDDRDLQWKLVVIMAHLFTKVPLSKEHTEAKFANSVVKLDPLPDYIRNAIVSYNKEVQFVFNQYFLCIARHLRPSLGEDNMLPLSKVDFIPNSLNLSDNGEDTLVHKIRAACYQREITSSFVALSGNRDNKLNADKLISNIRHEICPEINIVPNVYMLSDLNGYALDFYRHGSNVAINRDNRLSVGQDFTLLNDFRLVLNSTVLALEDLELEGVHNERLLSNFQYVCNEYNSLFTSAYYHKK